MIRSFDPVTEMFLSGLETVQNRIDTDTEQLSSGYRVNQPSDSPEDLMTIADLNDKLSSANQLQTNLARAKNEADSSESALESAVSILEATDVIASQALGVDQTSTTRSSMALQVQQLLGQMVGLSQLNVQGRYVFSGNNDQQAQYTLDSSNTTTGVDRAFETTATIQVADIFGQTFSPAMTANDIFDHRDSTDAVDSNNVFAAMEELYQALTDSDTDSGTTTINDAIDKLHSADTWLNNCLAFYGSVQNRLANSQDLATKYTTMWTTQLGEKRDTDTVGAISDLEASKVQQQAALGSYSQHFGQNLFDYLK